MQIADHRGGRARQRHHGRRVHRRPGRRDASGSRNPGGTCQARESHGPVTKRDPADLGEPLGSASRFTVSRCATRRNSTFRSSRSMASLPGASRSLRREPRATPTASIHRHRPTSLSPIAISPPATITLRSRPAVAAQHAYHGRRQPLLLRPRHVDRQRNRGRCQSRKVSDLSLEGTDNGIRIKSDRSRGGWLKMSRTRTSA